MSHPYGSYISFKTLHFSYLFAHFHWQKNPEFNDTNKCETDFEQGGLRLCWAVPVEEQPMALELHRSSEIGGSWEEGHSVAKGSDTL